VAAAKQEHHAGHPVRPINDADLLRGRRCFGDDLPVALGTLHALILRSPHAHAHYFGEPAAVLPDGTLYRRMLRFAVVAVVAVVPTR